MLILVTIFAGVAVAWCVAVNVMRPRDDPRSADAMRDAIARLAIAKGWAFHDHPTRPSATDPSGALRLVAGDEGHDFDAGATSLVRSARTAPYRGVAYGALAVFPRAPSDAAIETWGEEIATGDEVFDARFAVLARAPRDAVAALIGPVLRRRLLALETPALVLDEHGATLLLPGVPNAPTLERAVAVLDAVE
jgi:hypothetical protein